MGYTPHLWKRCLRGTFTATARRSLERSHAPPLFLPSETCAEELAVHLRFRMFSGVLVPRPKAQYLPLDLKKGL